MDVALPRQSVHDVLVLPRELGEDEIGRYHDTAIDLVKALRGEGVNAAFAHDPDNRQWIGEKSFLTYALDAVVGIFSSAAYEGLKIMLRRRHGQSPVRMRIARCVRTASGDTWEWYEVEGTGSDVAAALDQLNQPPDATPGVSE